jgi:hypothetical protein
MKTTEGSGRVADFHVQREIADPSGPPVDQQACQRELLTGANLQDPSAKA